MGPPGQLKCIGYKRYGAPLSEWLSSEKQEITCVGKDVEKREP